MTFFLILSLLPIQEGGYVVYLLNVDTSLYRHESVLAKSCNRTGFGRSYGNYRMRPDRNYDLPIPGFSAVSGKNEKSTIYFIFTLQFNM